ncbi:hypothetical protein ACH5RR_020818 [Cinchona calisaya]|uniref:At1g61320/AtMIF1 LRR domain-containing protein n=1 Tax=Cinchona calisaya TaxID=153742 RepID=A0ABD2ZGN1_9GENT
MMTYSLPFAPKLAVMAISFNGRGTVPYFFREVAKDCGQLTSLMIQTETDTLPYIPAKANTFSQLRSLYLLTMVDTTSDLLGVRPILAACPLLEYFRLLVRGPIAKPRDGKCAIAAGRHAHLKLMELQGFRWLRNEIELASYVLRSASTLERLCLVTSYTCFLSNFKRIHHQDYVMNDDKRQLIYKELEGQAISSNAVVNVQAQMLII